MKQTRNLRRLDATEAGTLRAIQDYLDFQQRQGRLLYIRHQPPMMTSKRRGGETKVIFKKVRESQLGASDLIVFRLTDNRRKVSYQADYLEFTEVFCIEVKSPTGKLSKEQQKWNDRAVIQGLRYIIARSLDDVMEAMERSN